MKIKGKIYKIMETKTYGQNGFRKREFVLETEDQYPQKILLELIKDDVDKINGRRVGERVECSINLRGTEWTNKKGEVVFFNALQVWRIEGLGTALDQVEEQPPQQEPAPDLDDLDDDDFPF